ncbi:MAG: winged helix DNA-binding domain-containing protein [Actinobacteria bacterium]|nr:MAG: winged helix DNA-binding domain-containing protein [Actinomycetota bacterium]
MTRIGAANARAERLLTLRELNRALLERQLLLSRKRLPVPRAVERLCALQAQYSPSPYIALWSRLSGFRKEQLTRALEERTAVKSTLFRITLHVTSARDYPYFAAAWLPAAREMTPRVTIETMAQLSRQVETAAQKPISHAELQAIAADQMRGRWRTRTLAPLLHLPPSGTWGFHGSPRLLVMQRWLEVDLPARDEGARHLLRSYLAAFGPATQQDLLRFAGVRVGDLRAGIDALELRRFRDERGRELLDLPRAPLPDADVPAPVRFLPKWDSALLAYAPPERARILADRHRSTVIRNNGDVQPTVLVDGFVAATWNVDKKRGLELEPLRRLTKAERAEVVEEGERLVEFVRD